jgi:predicted transposase YbfD/YdcC
MVAKREATMSIENSIVQDFADLEDFRIERNRIHPLINIVTVTILGVICGADNWVDVERYGQAKAVWLGEFLDLKNGIPSHDTFGRVFRWLDDEAFQARFIRWTARVCTASQGQVVAMDGKKLRRSGDNRYQKDGIWMVNAWAVENRMVLGQKKVADKSNEITAIPELIAQLDLQDCVVTVDALNTQTAIAQHIVEAQADYILAVKANQGSLHEDLVDLFTGFEAEAYQDVLFETAQQTSSQHGRQEFRQVWVVSQPEYRDFLRANRKWVKLHSLIKLVTVRNDHTSTRYFMSSWSASAQDFLHAIRDHWQVENGLHWVLDIAFREDESRIRKDHAPQNIYNLCPYPTYAHFAKIQ